MEADFYYRLSISCHKFQFCYPVITFPFSHTHKKGVLLCSCPQPGNRILLFICKSSRKFTLEGCWILSNALWLSHCQIDHLFSNQPKPIAGMTRRLFVLEVFIQQLLYSSSGLCPADGKVAVTQAHHCQHSLFAVRLSPECHAHLGAYVSLDTSSCSSLLCTVMIFF